MRRRRLLGGLAGAAGFLAGCSSGVIVNRTTPESNRTVTHSPEPTPAPRVVTPPPTPRRSGSTFRPVVSDVTVRTGREPLDGFPAVTPGSVLELVVGLLVWSHAGLVSYSSQTVVTDDRGRRVDVHHEPRTRLSTPAGPARTTAQVRIPTDDWSTGPYEAEVSVRDEVNDRISAPVFGRFTLQPAPTPTETPTPAPTQTPTPAPVVDHDIRVSVIYAGGWFGDLIVTEGGETETTAIKGDHTRIYEVDDDATELVVRAQKLDDSRRPLTVQIVVDGEVVAEQSTRERGGSIHLPHTVG